MILNINMKLSFRTWSGIQGNCFKPCAKTAWESSQRCFFENELCFKRQLIGFNPVYHVILSKFIKRRLAWLIGLYCYPVKVFERRWFGFNPVSPVILSIICKTADLVFNAEHHCNANGGAIPKSSLIKNEPKQRYSLDTEIPELWSGFLLLR